MKAQEMLEMRDQRMYRKHIIAYKARLLEWWHANIMNLKNDEQEAWAAEFDLICDIEEGLR